MPSHSFVHSYAKFDKHKLTTQNEFTSKQMLLSHTLSRSFHAYCILWQQCCSNYCLLIGTKQVFDKFYSFFPYKRGEFYTNRLWIQNMHIVCKKLDGIMEISCILKHSSVHTCITFAFSRACLLTIKKLKEYTIVLLFKWKVNI